MSSSLPDSFDALVIGGSLSGLTMALGLEQAGLSTLVVDRETPKILTDIKFDGRTTALSYSSVCMLEALGVWGETAPHACPILDIRVSDGESRLFAHYDHRDVGDNPMGHIVENIALRQALLKKVARSRTIRHIAPAEITELQRTSTGVSATLGDGRVVKARLAIGADGRGSKTRSGAGIRTTNWDYKQNAIVCNVAHEVPHHNIAHERFLPNGPFALLPLNPIEGHPHLSSVVWTERRDVAPKMVALNEADFCQELTRRFGDYMGEMTLVGGRSHYPLGLQKAERFIDPRLALVGDAAHVMHPIAGQGFNLGLRDIAALAEILAEGRRLGLDPGAHEMLARYQRWRQFDTTSLLAATDWLNRLFANDIPPLRIARSLGLAAVNQLPPVKRLFMRHAMGVLGDLPKLLKGEAL